MMKTIFTLLLLSLPMLTIAQQEETFGSIKKMQGIWEFSAQNQDDANSIKAYRIFKQNKSIYIQFSIESKTAFVIGDPFTWVGFWDEETEPKYVSQLKDSGNSFRQYYSQGTDYDSTGKILNSGSSCWLSFNEDGKSDDQKDYIRLYYKGTPDIFIKSDSIPKYILLALKKNKESWKRYSSFIGMKRIGKSKSTINSQPNSPTKMYLIKGDEVEVLEEKTGWIKIRFYGTKVIEGWIKKFELE